MLKLKIVETFGLSRLETISDVPAIVKGLCCELKSLISQFGKLGRYKVLIKIYTLVQSIY